MKLLNKALVIAWKDILSETRAREIISSVLVFAVLVIIIFNFAFSGSRQEMLSLAPGILWVTFSFAGVLSLNRSFIQEREENCLEGLMVCPVSREAIYLGKMFSSLFFMLFIEAVVLPVFGLLFDVNVITLPIITLTLLTTVGFVAVGTLFSALAVNTRAREMVLPILFFPIVSPIIIAAVNSFELTLNGAAWSEFGSWTGIIAAFDVIFLTASYLTFGFIVEK
jgi:heme exporter protein B